MVILPTWIAVITAVIFIMIAVRNFRVAQLLLGSMRKPSVMDNDSVKYGALYDEVVKIYPLLNRKDFILQERYRDGLSNEPSISNSSDGFRDVLAEYATGNIDFKTVLLDPYSRPEYKNRPEYPYAPWKSTKLTPSTLNELHNLGLEFVLTKDVSTGDMRLETKSASLTELATIARLPRDNIIWSYAGTPHITVPTYQLTPNQLEDANQLIGEQIITINGKQASFKELAFGYSLDCPEFRWFYALTIDIPDMNVLFGRRQWHITVAKNLRNH
jgi:hypothetical protein